MILLGVLEMFVLASLDDAMQASVPPVLVQVLFECLVRWWLADLGAQV